MKRGSLTFNFIFALLLCSCVSRTPQSLSRVESDIQKLDETLAQMRSGFSDPENPQSIEWVQKKIQAMRDIDQYARNFMRVVPDQNYTEGEKAEFYKMFLPRMAKIDEENTSVLKKLLQIHSWFKISQFGKQTDQNAWLLVQHADQDPEFQKQILKVLEKLYPKGETSPQNYAYLFDRVAASWGATEKRTLQRYGTQGECKGKREWNPIPLEDPSNLDKRRNEVGLPPMSEYIEKVKTLCQ